MAIKLTAVLIAKLSDIQLHLFNNVSLAWNSKKSKGSEMLRDINLPIWH